jgi:hypothetical protein
VPEPRRFTLSRAEPGSNGPRSSPSVVSGVGILSGIVPLETRNPSAQRSQQPSNPISAASAQPPAAHFKRLYRKCPAPTTRLLPGHFPPGTSDRVLPFPANCEVTGGCGVNLSFVREADDAPLVEDAGISVASARYALRQELLYIC